MWSPAKSYPAALQQLTRRRDFVSYVINEWHHLSRGRLRLSERATLTLEMLAISCSWQVQEMESLRSSLMLDWTNAVPFDAN